MTDYYLAGDIGATRTRLALCRKGKDIPEYKIEYFLSADYSSLESLIEGYLEKQDARVDKAVIAVAGPVINNIVTKESSNLPWEVTKKGLLNIPAMGGVQFINDLEALAASVAHLKENDLYVLHSGIRPKEATLAVIAPGTGLGEALS